MRVTTTWSSCGDEPLDLSNLDSVRRAGLLDVAAELLRSTDDEEPGDAFSRRNLFPRFAGDLPRDRREPLLNVLAEGWQILEQVGYVCKAPLAERDEWFVTRVGAGKRASGALKDELALARRI